MGSSLSWSNSIATFEEGLNMSYFKIRSDNNNSLYSETGLHVALCFDKNYLYPAINTMNSVFAHNKNVVFLCLCSNLDDESRKVLLSIADYGVRLIELTWDKVIDTRFYPIDVAFNIYIPWIVPNVEKVLYIDPDMICLKSIEFLFNEDFTIAMAPEISGMVEGLTKNIFKESTEFCYPFYFNSGTCFMNCGKIRKEHNVEEIDKEFIDKIADYYLLDQDFLNKFYHNDIRPLSILWNVQFYEFDGCYFYKKAIKNAYFIHFSFHKPWRHTSSLKQSKLYLKYSTNQQIILRVKAARRKRIRGKVIGFFLKPFVLIKGRIRK